MVDVVGRERHVVWRRRAGAKDDVLLPRRRTEPDEIGAADREMSVCRRHRHPRHDRVSDAEVGGDLLRAKLQSAVLAGTFARHPEDRQRPTVTASLT